MLEIFGMFARAIWWHAEHIFSVQVIVPLAPATTMPATERLPCSTHRGKPRGHNWPPKTGCGRARKETPTVTRSLPERKNYRGEDQLPDLTQQILSTKDSNIVPAQRRKRREGDAH